MKKSLFAILFLIILLGVLKAESFGLGGGIGVNICVGETCPADSEEQENQDSQKTTFTNLGDSNSDDDDENSEIPKTEFLNSEPIQLQEIKITPVEQTKTPKLNFILTISFVFMISLSVYLIKLVQI